MWLSLLIGILLVLLGTVFLVVAAITEALGIVHPPKLATAVDPVKLGEVVAKILEAFGKLRPTAQLMVVGLLLGGAGLWLLATRPF